MPKIFKVLASISVWALFITGLGGMVWSGVGASARPGGAAGELYHFSDAVSWTVSVGTLFLAVIVMKIRKELE